MASPLESTQALALPNATNHFCRSCGDGALRYMCCCPGITKSNLVLSMVFTGKQVWLYTIQVYASLLVIQSLTQIPNALQCFNNLWVLQNQFTAYIILTIYLADRHFNRSFTALIYFFLGLVIRKNAIFQNEPSGLPTCNFIR